MNRQTATLAGGCFWCLEAAFNDLQGVIRAVSGYMGGDVPQPTYEQVCGGNTGHAEVVQIEFDADSMDFSQLLEVFFSLHDPTTPNRQGNDVGTQYRSAIFFHTPEQEAQARALVARLTADQVFPRAMVTEISPAGSFWPAEDYQQGYAARNPAQPYCMFVVSPKLAKFRSRYAALLKSHAPGPGDGDAA